MKLCMTLLGCCLAVVRTAATHFHDIQTVKCGGMISTQPRTYDNMKRVEQLLGRGSSMLASYFDESVTISANSCILHSTNMYSVS